MPNPVVTFSPSVIPHCQQWLVERGHQPQDLSALAEIITQSLGTYLDCYARYLFFYRHDVHLIPALKATLNGVSDELHLPALRTPTGWIIGSPSDFAPTEQYHQDRLIDEARSMLQTDTQVHRGSPTSTN